MIDALLAEAVTDGFARLVVYGPLLAAMAGWRWEWT